MTALTSNQPIDAVAGRVTKITLPDGAAAVEILERPGNGRLTLDPDGTTLSYVSHDPGFSGSEPLSLRITRADGANETVSAVIDVTPGPQKAGWATGENIYMLRTDAADEVVVETGDNHRKVFVSGAKDALSRSDIERMEGVEVRDKDFGKWLAANPQYGGSEDMAVDAEVGGAIWSAITGRETAPSSHWLLLERGYDYAMGRLIDRGTEGESELHPVHVTAWGEGARPVLTDRAELYQSEHANIVITDVVLKHGIKAFDGQNLLFEDVRITNDTMSVKNFDGLTFRQGEIVDVTKEEPSNSNGWSPVRDRSQGIFVNKSEGLLMEQNLVDQTGWEEGYTTDRDPDTPQPPSQFSQNIYIQKEMEDVTFRDNISMRAASAGAQIRPGGLVEDNAFIDNNFGFSTGHGIDLKGGQWSGNYTLANGNLVTDAGHKEGINIGARSLGISDYSKMSVYSGNIVAHTSDPNDPDDYDAAKHENPGLKEGDRRLFDDTVVHNWDTWNGRKMVQERNTDGLDPEAMANTTIQLYTAALLGRKTATSGDLADHLRALTDAGGEVDADDILAFFRAGFDVEQVGDRSKAAELRFVPDELGDGVRWDNRVNWTTEDIPMDGDSVDLGGNLVHFGGTVDIRSLEFGPDGTLIFNHGWLGVETVRGGGEAVIDRAGQFWLEGWDGRGALSIDVDGGRFANTGALRGEIEIEAEGGQTILATGGASMTVKDGAIVIAGDDALVGFDGERGQATLRLEAGATLAFAAEADGLSTLTEFRSGAFASSNVLSELDLDGAALRIDVSDLKKAGVYDLVVVDAISGAFGDVSVTGLGKRDATVHLDMDAGTVSLTVLSKGSGRIELTDAAPKGAKGPLPGAEAPKDDDERDRDDDRKEDEDDREKDKDDDRKEDKDDDRDRPDPVEERVETDLDVPVATPEDDAALLEGGNGRDRIRGDEGDETILGGAGGDKLRGGDGDDALFGGTGSDALRGGAGEDALSGGTGNDNLRGGKGDDRLFGQDGRDKLRGEAGDDLLAGGAEKDVLIGGEGADIFLFDLSTDTTGRDRIADFDAAEGDLILIRGLTDPSDLTVDARNKRAIVSVDLDGDAFDLIDLRGKFAGLQVIDQDADGLFLG
jgi:hypothetical protein